MSQPETFPVIIVGAGPVGLCAALSLARRGIASLVLEREADLQADLRTATLQPPTLEMLEEIGLTAEILRRGLIAPTWQVRQHETHERAVFDLGVLTADTRHPYRVQFEQAAFCGLAFAAAQAERRIRVRLGATTRGIVRQDGGVMVQWEHGDTRERALARFVIGADGAGSTLRRLTGLAFEGLIYPETTILATTTFPFEDHLPGLSPINDVWFRNGSFSLARLPDRWCVSLYPDPDEDPASEPWRMEDPARIEAKLQRIVPKLGTYDLLGHRPWRAHPRIVPGYRSGNVLLAGDAAHVSSPSCGVGLNGGIHDAFNLADKLAQVFSGAGEDLLDLYDRQRRTVAVEEIANQADRNRLHNPDPASRRQELARLQSIAADRAAAREYLLDSSMITGLRRAAATT